MSGSNDISDERIIPALLDPVNVKIFEFLKTSGPFKVGLIKAKLTDIPLTKPGFLARLRKLEKLGFIVRLEKRGNKKIRKKNQHVTWQPYDAEFYEKLEQYRKELVRIADDIRALAKVSDVIPDAFDKFVEIKASYKDEGKVERLRTELRPSVETLLNQFGVLGDSMKKRALEWALEARYFENLQYT